tara:strand:- start:82 stop:279 length:198 start_codon:yes stop_codon:yes gene_type:complete
MGYMVNRFVSLSRYYDSIRNKRDWAAKKSNAQENAASEKEEGTDKLYAYNEEFEKLLTQVRRNLR